MAATKAPATKERTSSFSRNFSAPPASSVPGLKKGLNGTIFLSSGIPDLDEILGGGFHLGSLVMIMEDTEAPHHMLLLRNFMSQGLVHNQPVLYASPSKNPRDFLGTLPSILVSKDDKSRKTDLEPKDLRIAWQYKKYLGGNKPHFEDRDGKVEYCNDFDLKKPIEKHLIMENRVECLSLFDCPSLAGLRDSCSKFLSQIPRYDGNLTSAGRIAIQSFCAPQCEYYDKECDMLSFIRSLKSMVRTSNAVAFLTFPASLVSSSVSKRWQHMADTLLSVKAIPDEDKELASLLTGYQDMLGLLSVQKVARFNTQVPVILDATTFSIKLQKRRSLVLECLNQAPVDGSSGSSYGTSGSCSGSSKTGSTMITAISKVLMWSSIFLFVHGKLPNRLMGYTVEKIPESKFQFSEEMTRKTALSVASSWNWAVDNLKSISSGNDWMLFFKMALSLVIISWIGSMSLPNFFVKVLPFAFAVFYIYDQYEDEVDRILKKVFPIERLSNPDFLRLLNPFKPLDKHD